MVPLFLEALLPRLHVPPEPLPQPVFVENEEGGVPRVVEEAVEMTHVRHPVEGLFLTFRGQPPPPILEAPLGRPVSGRVRVSDSPPFAPDRGLSVQGPGEAVGAWRRWSPSVR